MHLQPPHWIVKRKHLASETTRPRWSVGQGEFSVLLVTTYPPPLSMNHLFTFTMAFPLLHSVYHITTMLIVHSVCIFLTHPSHVSVYAYIGTALAGFRCSGFWGPICRRNVYLTLVPCVMAVRMFASPFCQIWKTECFRIVHPHRYLCNATEKGYFKIRDSPWDQRSSYTPKCKLGPNASWALKMFIKRQIC